MLGLKITQMTLTEEEKAFFIMNCQETVTKNEFTEINTKIVVF